MPAPLVGAFWRGTLSLPSIDPLAPAAAKQPEPLNHGEGEGDGPSLQGIGTPLFRPRSLSTCSDSGTRSLFKRPFKSDGSLAEETSSSHPLRRQINNKKPDMMTSTAEVLDAEGFLARGVAVLLLIISPVLPLLL